MGGRCWGVAKR